MCAVTLFGYDWRGQARVRVGAFGTMGMGDIMYSDGTSDRGMDVTVPFTVSGTRCGNMFVEVTQETGVAMYVHSITLTRLQADNRLPAEL